MSLAIAVVALVSDQPAQSSPPEGHAAILSAIAAAIAAIAAIVALVIAYKAFTATRATPFTQLIVNELFSIMRRARETRSNYVNLFGTFATEADKSAACSAWIRLREEVGVSLDEMALLHESVKQARDLWKKVEEEEDSHTTSSNLTIGEDAKKAAEKRYDETHSAFVAKLTEVMRALK